jgi:hypothetical protein
MASAIAHIVAGTSLAAFVHERSVALSLLIRRTLDRTLAHTGNMLVVLVSW